MLSKKQIIQIMDETYAHAEEVPLSVYDTIAQDDASRAYKGNEKDNLPNPDQYDPFALVERIVAICNKEGKINTTNPYEMIETEDEFLCEGNEFERPGECELPYGVEHCPDAEFIGSIHTHPSYPPDPSKADWEVAKKQKSKAFCISARGDKDEKIGLCFFPDNPGDIPYDIVRDGDIDSDFCIPFEYNAWEGHGMMDAQACSGAFIEGWQLETIEHMRRLIEKKRWKGTFCHVKDIGKGKHNMYCIGNHNFWESHPKEVEK